MNRHYTVLLSLFVASLSAFDAEASGRFQLSNAINETLGPLTQSQAPLTGPAARAIQFGPLPYDAGQLAERKALAAAEAEQATPQPKAVSPTPTVLLGKNGLADPNVTPSDSTGAIGATRYIETVNSKVGIYDRNLNLINQNTLQNWWDAAGTNAFDPQVIWDATTNRFYYTGDAVVDDFNNYLAFGFSKTASPNNATTDWCHYSIAYGEEFPDYPKLGDSQHFAIIGVNTFSLTGAFRGSDILAIGKPSAAPISTCPDAATFKFSLTQNIKIGTQSAFTPTPANEIDTNPTGWIVARSGPLPANKIGLFKVTRNATTGQPVISAAGAALTVPRYDVPANAPQSGASFRLDTSDARLPQAVAAVDPARGGKFAVWTQHAIGGGAGSMERWYEIDPVNRVVLQSGNVSNPSLYYFNGAISPDRVVKGGTKAFGQTMLLNFNASSASTFPSIRMVSKRGANSVSAVKLVKQSPGPDIDFSCPASGVCRWGDYAAATSDPSAPITAAAGIVWSTSMWTKDGRTTGGTNGVSWQTWNWKSRP